MADVLWLSHLLPLVFLIVLSAFFSGSETGVMAINRYRLQHAARKGNQAAVMLAKLLSRPDRLLGVIIIGNQLANNMAVASVNIMADRLFGHQSVWAATFALTLVILIFAEVMPKTLAAFYPEKVAFSARWLLQILLWVLYPLVWVVNGIANSVLRLFGVQVKKKGVESLGHEELRGLIHVGANNIPKDHKNMLMGVLDLEHITVNDVMVPRHDVDGLDLNQTWQEVMACLIQCRSSEILVYEGQMDQVRGVLHIAKVIDLMHKDFFNKTTLLRALEPIHYIPEGISLSQQLKTFQEQDNTMALIVDEYGDIAGQITMNDIVEEIIGQYTPGESLKVFAEPLADGGFKVSGSCHVRDLNRAQGWTLPVDGPNTLGGLMLEHLETIPTFDVGIKIGRYALEVLDLKGRQILTIKVRELPEVATPKESLL